MRNMPGKLAILLGALLALSMVACLDDPGTSSEQPLYRWDQGDGSVTSAERGAVYVNELGWAGSLSDDGVYDPDDVFIELWNKHPRPVNFSGWRLNIDGDYRSSFRIPAMDYSIPTNGYLVIAAKADGAFGESADVILEGLKLGKRAVYIELRDNDQRLIESAGSRYDQPFSGGYDLVTVRSMERTQILFGNRGNQDRNWHANIDDAASNPTTRRGVREGFRVGTLASPGEANSADYSGATTSGTFE